MPSERAPPAGAEGGGRASHPFVRGPRPSLTKWALVAATSGVVMGILVLSSAGLPVFPGATGFGPGGSLPGPIASSSAPPGTRSAAMAYDPAGGYVLLFGGFNRSGYLADTWTFRAGAWTERILTPHPSARAGAVLAYDAVDHVMVLFGGCGAVCPLGDTWVYNSTGVWKQVFPSVHPPASTAGMMTYDGGDGYLLFFGGDTTSGRTGDLSGTWSFKGNQWAQLHPTKSPPAREYGSLVNDQTDGYVVLTQGVNVWLGANGVAYGDTWKFHGGQWAQLFPSIRPPARYGDSMSYDVHDGYALLFGGSDVSGGLYHDTWTFAKGAWTERFPGQAPSGRGLSAMTFDSGDGYVLLFGGKNYGTPAQGFLDDTWSFTAGTWSLLG